MFIQELNRHLAIMSREEAVKLLQRDRGFWNVVSICHAGGSRARLPDAKRVLYVFFDDTEDERPSLVNCPAKPEDLAQIFRFADSIGSEPLLIHCEVGLSRSPAVALALICRRLAGQTDFATKAVELLLQVRPPAKPNLLVLKRGLEQFLPTSEAAVLARNLVEHPWFQAGRSHDC